MMTIGLTDNMGSEKKLELYRDWILHGIPGSEVRVLSYNEPEGRGIGNCRALVLTGGTDVDPALYGGPAGHSTITAIDRKRDDFERALLDRAVQTGIPVLGICRGMQLVNVHFGGTLIPDIEEAGYPSHRSGNKDQTCVHSVRLTPGSLLAEVIGMEEGQVNSSHHQAVGKPGRGLLITARAADGIPEGMESVSGETKAPIVLVQWHPERMTDAAGPFARRLLDFLYNRIRKYN